jgi:hypothetical protein
MFLSRVYRWLLYPVCTILLSVSVCSTAHTATYFIDYENGNDSNNGTSQVSAW